MSGCTFGARMSGAEVNTITRKKQPYNLLTHMRQKVVRIERKFDHLFSVRVACDLRSERTYVRCWSLDILRWTRGVGSRRTCGQWNRSASKVV
jgi:hypothetical protein